MMIGLILPPHRADAVARALQTVAVLNRLGASFCTEAECLPLLPGARLMDRSAFPDLLISIGGDGTLLRAAKTAAALDIPLLGINTGRVGFLTETAPDDIEQVLPALLRGEYELDERAMLRASVEGLGEWTVLNDAIVTRAGYARLIRMHLFVQGQEAACYMADGLIVSTPTGSTGYSLSAGGPVVSPHVDCMLITPVCDHSLVHRPLVVPGGASIRIQLEEDEEMQARLQADGQTCAALPGGCSVCLRRADQTVKLVRMNSLRFFSRVRTKLSGPNELQQ